MGDLVKSPIQFYTVNGRVGGARLAHFFSGSATLLHGHKHWIDHHFIPKMKQHPNAWIDIYAHTSRLGSDAANKVLSQQRLDAVEQYIRRGHPGIRVNIRGAHGEEDAGSFSIEQKNNEGYWRAVLVRWFGIPIEIPVPEYPEEKPFKWRAAPKGCWLITGVDTFGVPIALGITGGKMELTLLNDQGEQYVVQAVGAGIGVEIGADADDGAKGVALAIKKFGDLLKAIGMKAGDLQNVSEKIKNLNIVGPNGTTGGIMRGSNWAANLKIGDIVGSKSFIVANGELQMLMAGGEIGLILFGGLGDAGAAAWGYYQSLGLATYKGGVGAAATMYRITSWSKTIR